MSEIALEELIGIDLRCPWSSLQDPFELELAGVGVKEVLLHDLVAGAEYLEVGEGGFYVSPFTPCEGVPVVWGDHEIRDVVARLGPLSDQRRVLQEACSGGVLADECRGAAEVVPRLMW